MPELPLTIRRRGVLVKALVRPRSQGPVLATSGPLLAYLDSGASDTMLDLGVVRSLGLQPLRSVALNVLGRAEASFHETYAVEIALVAPGEPPVWWPFDALGGAVFPTGAVAALGRDLLRHCVFEYNGPAGRAKLRW
jgi:hypothetical protein